MNLTPGERFIAVEKTLLHISVLSDAKDVLLLFISTPPEYRRQGYANKAMEELCCACDENGLRIFLYAAPDPASGFSLEDIITWYMRWGFTPHRKRNSQALMRMPK